MSSQAPPNRRIVWRPNVLFPLAALVLFLLVWEVFGRASDPIIFAPPTTVVQAYGELLSSGELLRETLVTLNAATVGFLLAVVVGLPMGLLLGRKALVSELLDNYILAIYSTPRVVLVPLIIMWFGVGYSGRVFVVWLGAVIPVILNTAAGVRYARPDLVEVARSFGASERELARHVVLPGSVPYVIAGFRIAAGRAFIGVLIAELFLDLTGVGGLIASAAAYFDVPVMLAVILWFVAIATATMEGIGMLERRVSSWKDSSQDGD